jgi:DNA processing protein
LIDSHELAAWLRLLTTPGVSRGAARRLMAAFGGPRSVFDVPAAACATRFGAELSAALAVEPAGLAALHVATRRWLDEATADAPRHLVTLGDPGYPALLLETADPPLLLHAVGRLELLQAPAIAIVGSRHATPQGVDNARAFGRHLSQRGLAIVSGLALGIDAAAHEGALDGAGGTIAVVGTGLDIVYPARHASLAARIARDGLIVSEYPLGTESRALHFPQRNRVIAGLARGTLVVEAALQSGSLITARQALEAGREVFAIPGSIHAPQSRGCHRLIQQGAKLVATGDDVLEELKAIPGFGLSSLARPKPAVRASSSRVAGAHTLNTDTVLLAALGHDPTSLDVLSARTGCGASELGVRLLELELQGRVARLPGGRIQRRADG